MLIMKVKAQVPVDEKCITPPNALILFASSGDFNYLGIFLTLLTVTGKLLAF